MHKIDVFIAGAQKAGTTSIKEYLDLHHSVKSHPQTECSYFYQDYEFAKGNEYLFHHYFNNSGKDKINIAKHAHLTRSENALKRLREHNPDCKIIFSVRNPIKRAYSSYLMEFGRGFVKDSFEEVVDISMSDKSHWYYNLFIDLGFYNRHIERLNKYFPKEQISVINFEEWKLDAKESLKKLYKWLNLPAIEMEKKLKVYNDNQKIRLENYHSLYSSNNAFLKFIKKQFNEKQKQKVLKWYANIAGEKMSYEPVPKHVEKRLEEIYHPYNDDLSVNWGINFNKY